MKCEYCGRKIPTSKGPGRKLRYCPDRACRQRAYEQRRIEGNPKNQKEREEQIAKILQLVENARFQWRSYEQKAERRDTFELSAWTIYDDVRDYFAPILEAIDRYALWERSQETSVDKPAAKTKSTQRRKPKCPTKQAPRGKRAPARTQPRRKTRTSKRSTAKTQKTTASNRRKRR